MRALGGGAVVVAATAAVVAAASSAAVKPCKPVILSRAEIAQALGLAAKKIETQPAAPEGVPTVAGVSGTDYECDWGLVTSGHIGRGDGRASLFVFASAADAAAWFDARVAGEKPLCRTVAFADAACYQPGKFPAATYPLFQALQGRYVVWIHLIQPRLDLSVLQSLAGAVLARADAAR